MNPTQKSSTGRVVNQEAEPLLSSCKKLEQHGKAAIWKWPDQNKYYVAKANIILERFTSLRHAQIWCDGFKKGRAFG